MKLAIVMLLVTATYMLPIVARAQQPPSAPNAPLELPDFLVTGRAIMDIAGGAKQTPQKPVKMGRPELDSLNPTEKFPTPLVPNRPLPLFKRTHTVALSYADMSLGSYFSPSIVAGHSLKLAQYLVDLEGYATHSQQWQPGAFRTNLGGTLSSSYIAPEKFLFFGKGLTETDISVTNSTYTMFADSSAPVRSALRVFGGVTTEALVNNVPILAGLSWNTSRLSEVTGSQRTDSRLHGDFRCDVGRTRSVTLMAAIDAQTLDSSSYPFIQAGGSTSLGDSMLPVTLSAGLQYATSTMGDTRLGAEIRAQATYYASLNSTYTASLRSGLRRVGFSDFLALNPYVSSSASVDIPYDLLELRGTWKYHPTTHFQTVMGIGIRRSEREAIWQNADVRTFLPVYRAATALDLWSEVFYQITERDRFNGALRVRSVTLDSQQTATYVEPLAIDVRYQRAWNAELHTSFNMQYVGKRQVRLSTNGELDAYLNVSFSAKYSLGSGLSLTLDADNLINSSIMLWNGYRERGIFVSGGITWRM